MLNIRATVLFIGLAVLLTFNAREYFAVKGVSSQTTLANRRDAECESLPSRYSLHPVYVKEMGMWLPYTEDGPTGMDGGMIHLLSIYRSCSR